MKLVVTIDFAPSTSRRRLMGSPQYAFVLNVSESNRDWKAIEIDLAIANVNIMGLIGQEFGFQSLIWHYTLCTGS